MRIRHAFIALCLTTALGAGAAGQDKSPDAKPAKTADPMANYARLIGGEWQTTFPDGVKGYQAWQWGPGKHSIRKMAYATGTADNPWGGEVMYWHPGRKVVWVLSLHEDIPAVGRGVSEGPMKFEGDTAEGVAELHQSRGPRKLGSRWVFDGPDKYRDTLLEDTGAGLKPMNGWEFVRVKERVKVPPKVGEAAPAKLRPHLKVFESLLGHTWGAQGDSANAFHIQTSFELIPSLEVINARVVSPNKGGEPTQLLDVYFYHHLGTKQLRCLALSNHGGVYEGTWAVDGEALQLDLKGYEGDKVVPHAVRIDLEKNGTLRSQVCTINGAEKKVLFDVRHKR